MRVPPPGLLRLDREALLTDVRERISEWLPAYADAERDPTDPAWLLLEQAAWLVELLSEQLDRYPFSVVRHLVHLMGGHLRPAQPAVGVVVAEVAQPGVLSQPPNLPDLCRLFTPQTETSESIEFVPVEESVPLCKGSVRSMAAIRGGELFEISRSAETASPLEMWRGRAGRSRIFEREQIDYVVMTNNTDGLVSSLEGVIERLAERRIGWLKVVFEKNSAEQVTITAEIDLGGAFRRVAAGGVWGGGDLPGDWGTLDESTWRPPVAISDHAMLPRQLRGARPHPRLTEGEILIPNVPQDFRTDDLLVGEAAPLPETVVETIWQTLANMDGDLMPLRPTVSRRFRPDLEGGSEDPSWIRGALESGMWFDIARGADKTITEVHVDHDGAEQTSVRLALVVDRDDPRYAPSISVYGCRSGGRVDGEPLARGGEAIVWRLPAPPARRRGGLVQVIALDLTVPGSIESLLVVTDADPLAVMLNAMMVTNMPAVRDGRVVVVERNVPEAVSLLFEDLVSPTVIDQLLEQPIPRSAASRLRRLRLAHFEVTDQDDLTSWEGVGFDPAAGEMVLNAPDALGQLRQFRPSDNIQLSWYRRTDGEHGLVDAGAIDLVEQPADIVPALVAVRNPLGTFFGAARESPEAAIDRMFAPKSGVPVLPADFEREVRQALGSRGHGWMVRCWTYAERTLVSTAWWPVPESFGAEDPETRSARRSAEHAGPQTILVVLGSRDGPLSSEDLVWARRVVSRRMRVLARRLPTIRDAIVTRFHPLTLRTTTDSLPEGLVLPCFDPGLMRGELIDLRGRTHAPPRATLLLNAAVVAIDRFEQDA